MKKRLALAFLAGAAVGVVSTDYVYQRAFERLISHSKVLAYWVSDTSKVA